MTIDRGAGGQDRGASRMSEDWERARKFTTIALHRAIAGDWPGAAQYIGRLNGSAGLLVAIQLLADTYLGHVHPGHRLGDPVRVAWMSMPGQGVAAADEVRPSVRWAGQIIAARAADDWPSYEALLRAPAQGAELGDGIMALLDIVATSATHIEEVRAKGKELSGGGAS